MLALGLPAATLQCSAERVKKRACRAASLKVWGLTAHTTMSQASSHGPAAYWATRPKWPLSLSLASAKGSTT